MGNKVATFTEQQLEDYQVSDLLIDFQIEMNSIGTIIFLFDTRIAPISQERRFLGESRNFPFTKPETIGRGTDAH